MESDKEQHGDEVTKSDSFESYSSNTIRRWLESHDNKYPCLGCNEIHEDYKKMVLIVGEPETSEETETNMKVSQKIFLLCLKCHKKFKEDDEFHEMILKALDIGTNKEK